MDRCNYRPKDSKDGQLPPEAGIGEEGLYPESHRQDSPADILTADFQIPELGENKFQLFETTQFVGLCYGRSSGSFNIGMS